MLIMTAGRSLCVRWSDGYTRIVGMNPEDDRHELKVQDCPWPIFKGTEDQCKAVLDLIFTAHGAGENFVVPTPEELTQDDDTIKRIVAEAILTSERRQQRKAEREVATQIMADAWLRDNDPMGGVK